jgi:hypothetical protein
MEGLYKVKETKKEMLNFYASNIDRLNSISIEQMNKHSFISELIHKCEQKEKSSKVKFIMNRVKGLETHAYAPEMNELVFNNNEVFKAPQAKTIEEAVTMFISKSSLIQIKNLIYRTKPN